MEKRKLAKLAGIISGLLGVAFLAVAFFPIISYEVYSKAYLTEHLSPVPENSEPIDFTKASNWFAGDSQSNKFKVDESKIQYYTLSVPKLKIADATVRIGGESLDDYLVQYPGTALPGKIGNSVVFGHSILPQFYDPKNYLSIFSLLPKLKKGDEIYVNYDGISYKYEVVDKFEVKPTQLEVLDQDGDGSYISLITCTPPGHPLKPKRLVVKAKLVQNITKSL